MPVFCLFLPLINDQCALPLSIEGIAVALQQLYQVFIAAKALVSAVALYIQRNKLRAEQVLLGAILNVVQYFPLGKMGGIEGRCRYRRILGNGIQHITDFLIIGAVGAAIPHIALCKWHIQRHKESETDRHRRSQSRHTDKRKPQIRQIHRHKVNEAGGRAEGILEENIMLILVIRHQIDKHIRDE